MQKMELYPVFEKISKNALINAETYQQWYKQSISNPQEFWGNQAKDFLTWFKPWDEVLTGSLEGHNVRWFTGAKLNAAYNCLDRHLIERANQTAIIWESDDPTYATSLTYKELYEDVCRFSNVLKHYGIKRGDRVCIYLPMIPEVVVAMLACARIGAVHSVVFAGFSAAALKTRILDTECRLVITANEALRGTKLIPLKHNVDTALIDCPSVQTVIVVKRTENFINWNNKRDVWYANALAVVSAECPAEEMDANDPFFILYTSGSTGKPKGILHGLGGYLLHAATSFKYVFDYRDQEIFWCTADVGWITGHTYVVYGPLTNGATILMFEGVPTSPTPARFWEVIDKHKVNIFYTAPTAIRALRREGDHLVTRTSRESLRLLGTVGEPINPEAWVWYFDVVGKKKCPIIDTWWQTETGACMISPFPGATPLKPGSACWPYFGVVPKIVDETGKEAAPNQMGKLIITQPWPGMMLTIYKDQARFVNNYFSDFPGNYYTGDLARRDQDGYFWIAGRSDDVIKISGHRIGTQEVESAIVAHEAVAEAAVVAIPHDIKGQAIFAFVSLKAGYAISANLKTEIREKVRIEIGAIATPEAIHLSNSLPKTRSGKIMRRILRKIACGEVHDLGDLSTLADPEVVDDLVKEFQS